nr:MAG TPA_asm: hypothetical protein [Caudoviricetes sp.]
MWLAVADRLLTNLDILTAHPTPHTTVAGEPHRTEHPRGRAHAHTRDAVMGTATLTAPITDEGMRMTPGELIEEFYERPADLNTDMRNPRIYLVPKPGAITVDRPSRRVSAVVEYADKKHFRRSR